MGVSTHDCRHLRFISADVCLIIVEIIIIIIVVAVFVVIFCP